MDADRVKKNTNKLTMPKDYHKFETLVDALIAQVEESLRISLLTNEKLLYLLGEARQKILDLDNKEVRELYLSGVLFQYKMMQQVLNEEIEAKNYAGKIEQGLLEKLRDMIAGELKNLAIERIFTNNSSKELKQFLETFITKLEISKLEIEEEKEICRKEELKNEKENKKEKEIYRIKKTNTKLFLAILNAIFLALLSFCYWSGLPGILWVLSIVFISIDTLIFCCELNN